MVNTIKASALYAQMGITPTAFWHWCNEHDFTQHRVRAGGSGYSFTTEVAAQIEQSRKQKRHAITTGQVFDSLTVTGESFCRRSNTKAREIRWYVPCICACGNRYDAPVIALFNGMYFSCGCRRKEIKQICQLAGSRAGAAKIYKHGGGVRGNTRLFSIHCNMLSRCENPARNNYAHYGGRGIAVCKEWHDFVVFREWANSNGYTATLTIDRIDVNLGYCPSNCRWATMKQQQNNRRNTLRITAFGEEKTTLQWADDYRCVVSRDLLTKRISESQWQPERAITEPARRTKTVKGILKQLALF